MSEQAAGLQAGRTRSTTTRADPKRFFWRATYDSEGRIVALETFAYPMCLQSQLTLSYSGKDLVPVKRQRQPANDCKPAKTF